MSTALQGELKWKGDSRIPTTLYFTASWMEWDSDSDYALHNSAKIRFSIAKNRLAIEKTAVAGEGTSLILAGIIPLDDSSNLDLSLNGA